MFLANFFKKDDAFYQARANKLQTFLWSMVRGVVVKDNIRGQTRMKKFIKLNQQWNFPELVVKFAEEHCENFITSEVKGKEERTPYNSTKTSRLIKPSMYQVKSKFQLFN